MSEVMAMFGVEIDAKVLTKEQFNNIINDLDVFVIDDLVYVGLSPEVMDDDETLYEFKSRICEIIQDYLPDIDEGNVTFYASSL